VQKKGDIRIMRTSPVHYIAPSAISIEPNCNGTSSDLAVTISRNAKIKVYSPRAGIDKTTDGEYQEWTLTGRNRRLADWTKPYTIYARLSREDRTNGYLVFVKKDEAHNWADAYSSVSVDGYSTLYLDQFGNPVGVTNINYFYVRLGDVSLPDANNQRTVTLDTGILGTDQFNDEWSLRPDELPLRIDLGCTINDEDVGTSPYVYWDQQLVLTATITEGWTGTDIQRFDHWEISRKTDNDPHENRNWLEGDIRANTFSTSGEIILKHKRDEDDFNGAVAATFTIMAMEANPEYEEGSDLPPYLILKSSIITILAETIEKYELSLSETIVSYDPQTQNYSPDGGVNVGIRGTDQRGEVFDMTLGQIANASLEAEYAPVGSTQWTKLTFSDSSQEAATANIATTAFALQQSVNVRLMRRITADGKTVAEKELSRATIAFVRDGEDSKIREWIYRLNSNTGYDATTGTAGGTAVSGQTDGVDNCLLVDDFVPSGWSDDPTGVSKPGDVEWESWRDYDDENHRWGTFHAPVIHNRYAEDAVTYDIVTSVSVINAKADGTIETGDIEVRAFSITGAKRTEILFIAHLDGSPAHEVKFSIDGKAWRSCERLRVEEDGMLRMAYGIPAASVRTAADGIALRLVDGEGAVLKEAPQITVVKDGDTGPKGDDAQEVNTNILLRTIFDRGMPFVLEAWYSNSDTYVTIDTNSDTVVNGRKSIRLNAKDNGADTSISQNLIGKLKANTWYTLSFNAFLANGGGRLVVSFLNLFDGTRTNIFGNDLKVILDGEDYQVSNDGFNDVLITGDWDGKRHTITFLTNNSISTETLNLQFYQAFDSGTGNHSIACICMPKLEEGRVATAYMAHEDDLKGDNAPYNEHAYALSRSRTSHADGDLYQVNGVRWLQSAPDPKPTHPYVWERIMHYTAAGVNDKTSYICLTGAVGAMGKLCYMAGEYREDVEYTSNDSQTVAVEVSGTNDTTDIYYLNAESNWPDGTAQSAIGPTDGIVIDGKPVWVLGMSQYNLVRARYLFADFAQFGAAVVSGDWLISVHGTINGTAYEGKYTDPATYTNGSETKPTYFWFDPAYPNEDHAGKPQSDGSQWGADHHNFIPHYAVNLLTGKTYQNDAYIRGEVHATSGEFSGVLRKRKTVITADNIDQYAITSLDSGVTNVIDIIKSGTFLEFERLQGPVIFELPSFTPRSAGYTEDQLDEARSLIGNRMIIYNNSEYRVVVFAGNDRLVLPGYMFSLVCKPYMNESDGYHYEGVAWELEVNAKMAVAE